MTADIQKELALQLAWYMECYGEIPHHDQTMLYSMATGRLRDEKAVRLSKLTDEILEYFQLNSQLN